MDSPRADADALHNRVDWDRYRADPNVRPGSALGAGRLSFLSKLARAAAAYARQASNLKTDLAKYLNVGQKNVTREEFLDFKKSLEFSLKEVTASLERSAAEQKKLIDASNTATSEVMQRAFNRLDQVSQEVKAALEASARSQETTAESAKKILKLMDELASALKEAPPSNIDVLFARVEKLAFWPKKVNSITELLSQYFVVIGGICMIAGILDEKDEDLRERFFPSNSPVLYEDIACRTRDILFKDFALDLSVLVETQSSEDLMISSFIRRSPLEIIVQHQMRLTQGKVDLDISVDTTNHVSSLLAFPGALGPDYFPKLRLSYPFRDSSVCLDAYFENAAVRANVSMHPVRGDALLSLSGLFGTKAFNVGGCMEFDHGNVRRSSYSVGGSFNTNDFTACLKYNNRDQLLVMVSQKLEEKSMIKQLMDRSSIGQGLYSLFAPTTGWSIGAQLIHCSTTQSTVAAMGVEYKDLSSVLKFRLANSGVLSAVLKTKAFGESTVALKTQVNVTNLAAAPRVGVSISFNPAA